MKQKLLFMLCLVVCFTVKAQETTVDLSMGAGYANQVYYKLDTDKTTSFPKNSWDIAFYRASNRNLAMYVNDADGIEVFEASANKNDWGNITITQEANWKQLYNSDKKRGTGAFMKGSAQYGWGDYNFADHTVYGKIIFVLKYTVKGKASYKKFFCEKYFGAYTFKYASWNADNSKWTDDKTVTLSNTINDGYGYNFYSLRNNKEIIASPKTADWDFVFTKYITDVTDNKGNIQKYPVTGVLKSENVTVAKSTGDKTNELTYSQDMNAIGYNWKSFNFKAFSFDVDSNQKFYVKYTDGTVYKVYFTTWSGSRTGNIQFKTENVTNVLSMEDLGEKISFGVYPNPVGTDRKIDIVYDVKQTNNNSNKVEIFNVRGQKVFQQTVTNNAGFYNNQVDLQDLNSGIYMLRFTSGSYQKTKKIILK